jgi:hypothetical protein
VVAYQRYRNESLLASYEEESNSGEAMSRRELTKQREYRWGNKERYKHVRSCDAPVDKTRSDVVACGCEMCGEVSRGKMVGGVCEADDITC